MNERTRCLCGTDLSRDADTGEWSHGADGLGLGRNSCRTAAPVDQQRPTAGRSADDVYAALFQAASAAENLSQAMNRATTMADELQAAVRAVQDDVRRVVLNQVWDDLFRRDMLAAAQVVKERLDRIRKGPQS